MVMRPYPFGTTTDDFGNPRPTPEEVAEGPTPFDMISDLVPYASLPVVARGIDEVEQPYMVMTADCMTHEVVAQSIFEDMNYHKHRDEFIETSRVRLRWYGHTDYFLREGDTFTLWHKDYPDTTLEAKVISSDVSYLGVSYIAAETQGSVLALG